MTLDELADKINQLDALMKFFPCIICGEEIYTWACVIPEDKNISLGFGEPNDKNMTRIAFVHACRTHDFNDENVIELARKNIECIAEYNARKN